MPVDYEVRDNGVAVVTYNSPQKMNALTPQDTVRVTELLHDIRVNPKVRVAIITGVGERAMTAGVDLRYVNTPEFRKALEEHFEYPGGLRLNMTPYTRGIDIWKPLIAAINGHAIAMGACVVLGCDIRIASTNATFSLNEVVFGGLAAGGAMARLPRQVPYAYAMDLLLTGRPTDAQEMLKFGLVTEVLPPDRLMPRALEIADKLAGLDKDAVQITKQAAVRGLDIGLHQALVEEALYMEMLNSRHGKPQDDMLRAHSAGYRK